MSLWRTYVCRLLVVVVVVVVVRVVVTMVFVMPLLSANMRTFPVNDLRAA